MQFELLLDCSADAASAGGVNPAVLMLRGLTANPALVRRLRQAFSGLASVVTDAIFLSFTVPLATGELRLLKDSDEVNTFGNVYNTTDQIVDAVMGAPPVDPNAPPGGAISAAGQGDAGRLRYLLAAGWRADSAAPAAGSSPLAAATGGARRRLALTLIETQPQVSPPNASSTQLRLGFVFLAPTISDAIARSQLFAAESTGATAALAAPLGAALGAVAAALNVTSTYSIPLDTVRTVTLPYSRSWLYMLLAYLRANAVMAVAAFLWLVLLLLVMVWRHYCKARALKCGAPRKKTFKLVQPGRAGREGGGETSAEEEERRARARASSPNRLAVLKTALGRAGPMEAWPSSDVGAPARYSRSQDSAAAGGDEHASAFGSPNPGSASASPRPDSDSLDDAVASVQSSASADAAALESAGSGGEGEGASASPQPLASPRGAAAAAAAAAAVRARRRPEASTLRPPLQLSARERSQAELEADALRSEAVARELQARPTGWATRAPQAASAWVGTEALQASARFFGGGSSATATPLQPLMSAATAAVAAAAAAAPRSPSPRH